MRYDELRQCGVRSRVLGLMISMSIPPYAGYEEMVMKAKEQFLLMICRSLMIHMNIS